MAEKKIKVEWHKEASLHFNQILEYLSNESEQAVSIVGNSILDEIEKLPKHTKAHSLDRFKRSNDGNYRALIVYSYRISYYVDINIIYILRIRHMSREPLEY